MELKMPHKREDKGQVGIGTLIVFIAMVLVAAIAAGVLINTAGFLQSSAEDTGQGASEQTTNRLTVASSVTGTVSGNQITNVSINVKRAQGAEDIDLSDTTIQFVGPNGVADLTYTSSSLSGADGNPNFGVTTVQDNDNSLADGSSDPVLNDATDQAKIVINLGTAGGSNVNALQDMSTGEDATLTLTTRAGGETEVRISVPDTLSSSSAVTLSP